MTEYRQPSFQEINKQIEEFRGFAEEWQSDYYENMIKQGLEYKESIFGK